MFEYWAKANILEVSAEPSKGPNSLVVGSMTETPGFWLAGSAVETASPWVVQNLNFDGYHPTGEKFTRGVWLHFLNFSVLCCELKITRSFVLVRGVASFLCACTWATKWKNEYCSVAYTWMHSILAQGNYHCASMSCKRHLTWTSLRSLLFVLFGNFKFLSAFHNDKLYVFKCYRSNYHE